jgi:O-succinylbenzoic acid--CoA ligase
MAEPLTYLKFRKNKDWLIGDDAYQFQQVTEEFFQELAQFSRQKVPPKIILAEPNPLRFLAAFLAAVAAKYPVFLCNPNWVQQEWQQVFELVQPDLIFGQDAIKNFPISHSPISLPPSPFPHQIMIPTGGSSGKIRFAVHTWETLMASVQGFYQYFGSNPVNSYCVLPLYHVSGLMQFMRSLITDGQLIIKSFKEFKSVEELGINPTDFFISLVPTQLQRCLQNSTLRRDLAQFKTVLLGGAPAWESLLQEARHYNIPLSLTYGMTETASQIVTLKPEYFLSGNNTCGQVLPHAKITIYSSTGEKLGTNQTGIISIQADSLALGYYPIHQSPVTPNLNSDDLGFIDEQGYLHLVGRNSNKIITGGENVFPVEVEAAIQATQLVSDVYVIGIPDAHWGQIVTAVYVPCQKNTSVTVLQARLANQLSKYKQPKYWICVEHLPRNPQGKVNRPQIEKIVTTWLETQQLLSQRFG